jgi:hypothetical protein
MSPFTWSWSNNPDHVTAGLPVHHRPRPSGKSRRNARVGERREADRGQHNVIAVPLRAAGGEYAGKSCGKNAFAQVKGMSADICKTVG